MSSPTMLVPPSHGRSVPTARAVWTGAIGFGLVNIPVRLYNGTVPMTVRFHEFDQESGRRIRHSRVVEEPWEDFSPPSPPETSHPVTEPSAPSAPLTPPPAPRDDGVVYRDVVKGYEVEPGRFVMLSQEELERLRPERSRTIDITEFVSLDDMDPVYFDRTYYVAPARGAGAEKPYSLLLRALQRSRRVGIGSFVLTSRLHLAAIRPRQDVLVLETLFYGDEVRPVAEIGFDPALIEPNEKELDVATRLIDLLEAEWDPSRYRDDYRQRVLDLIASKAPEAATVVDREAMSTATPGVADLMAALQASVEAAKQGPSGRSRSRRRTG
jgi:DNA end-binding protein Ku